jgi:DNA-binding HxlR family transcriptional regulator
MLVLRQAFSGVRRFEQFRDQLGVAENVLSKRLTTMVDAGLLRRVPYEDRRRTRHEYVLTEAGPTPSRSSPRSRNGASGQWGERHRPHADPGIRMDIVHRSCGHPSTTAEFCSHCNQRLIVEATSWRKSWRDPQDLKLTGAAA